MNLRELLIKAHNIGMDMELADVANRLGLEHSKSCREIDDDLRRLIDEAEKKYTLSARKPKKLVSCEGCNRIVKAECHSSPSGSEHEERGCHWWWINFTCPKCGRDNKQVTVGH